MKKRKKKSYINVFWKAKMAYKTEQEIIISLNVFSSLRTTNKNKYTKKRKK